MANYEKKDDTSNLERIVKNVQANVGGGAGGDVDLRELADELTGSRKVQIDHFVLKDAKVHVRDKALQGHALEIPPLSLELRHLGTGPQGATVSEISAKVMKRIATRVSLTVTAQVLTAGLTQVGKREPSRQSSGGGDVASDAN